ncbi:KH domain-containing protein HEN4-like protein [Tanacetum coccineum]
MKRLLIIYTKIQRGRRADSSMAELSKTDRGDEVEGVKLSEMFYGCHSRVVFIGVGSSPDIANMSVGIANLLGSFIAMSLLDIEVEQMPMYMRSINVDMYVTSERGNDGGGATVVSSEGGVSEDERWRGVDDFGSGYDISGMCSGGGGVVMMERRVAESGGVDREIDLFSNRNWKRDRRVWIGPFTESQIQTTATLHGPVLHTPPPLPQPDGRNGRKRYRENSLMDCIEWTCDTGNLFRCGYFSVFKVMMPFNGYERVNCSNAASFVIKLNPGEDFDKISNPLSIIAEHLERLITDNNEQLKDPKFDLDDHIIIISGPSGNAYNRFFLQNPNEPMSAPQDAVLRVQTRIIRAAPENKEQGPTGKIIVSSNQIGCVLSKGGAVISEIRKSTEAYIHILGKDQTSQYVVRNEDVVQIFGNGPNMSFIVTICGMQSLKFSSSLDHFQTSTCKVILLLEMQQLFLVSRHFSKFNRFHPLKEFDEVKRSCRKCLDGNNGRWRKPRAESMYLNYGSYLADHQGL